jgi:hypothetical protein
LVHGFERKLIQPSLIIGFVACRVWQNYHIGRGDGTMRRRTDNR